MGPPARTAPFDVRTYALFDDLDDAAGARIDQHGAAVHDGVAVIVDAVFGRHLVIGDPVLRQDGADPDVLAIRIGRTVLFHHIAVEARALVDAEHAGNSSDHAADDTPDHGTDRSCGTFAIARASFNPARHALGLRQRGYRQSGDKGGHSDKTANHAYSRSIR